MIDAASRIFADRHVGPNAAELARILELVGVDSLDELATKAVPSVILDAAPNGIAAGLDALPLPVGEHEALAELTALAAQNTVATSMIGLGYFDTLTPPVLLRNIIENPAWYTAYTPYQPEISQGRLEALLNFQTMVADLSGMELANSSMLDEATAAAEAMTLLRRANRSKSPRFVVDADLYPQTLAVIETRAEPLGIEIVSADLTAGLPEGDFFGVLAQIPGASGRVVDYTSIIAEAHERGALVAVGADLLAMTLITSPGELGADACFGTTQRFGVPMGYGGPHAGYLAVHSKHARQLPGRLVGVSIDADGDKAYRLALQTREQHIRREKATSNICTAQVLLAILAAMYASYHGAEGLKAIALRVAARAHALANGLREGGVTVVHDSFFDTVLAQVPGKAADVVAAAKESGINLRLVDADHVGISCDEATTADHVLAVLDAFGIEDAVVAIEAEGNSVPAAQGRTSDYLQHEAFTRYRTETAMLRYLRALSDKDIALDRSMIPLGSCTMKLNATAEMESITWPAFNAIHPFAPTSDAPGLLKIIKDLEDWLVAVTGYDNVSLQPNAGSQGEYAGLLAIRNYHLSRGDDHRDTCLIPSSAHGTNAASAVMAGMRVEVVACRPNGDVDVDDLRAKIADHAERLAAIMITYPSTHGVYEHEISDICAAVHDAGGQVYVDGANLNALVGLARPGRFGGDVSHLNLHKTFCIPHGGGGPGVGPIGVKSHLAPFLPGHAQLENTEGAVCAAPFGSASILPITWMYIRMMGGAGLKRASQMAILNANYIARRLEEHYPVLYTGGNGLVAHECILDLRPLKDTSGISVDDVAKRLIDFGFHAPTMSFPVAGTLMIEPTESESKEELDRFCDAMIQIREEIRAVENGSLDKDDNPLKNAPHTAAELVGEWAHGYSREQAVYPLPSLVEGKYWPPVGRVDNVFGDRNLVCACPSIESYQDA